MAIAPFPSCPHTHQVKMFQVEKQRFDTGLKTKAKATVLVDIQDQHRAFRLYL